MNLLGRAGRGGAARAGAAPRRGESARAATLVGHGIALGAALVLAALAPACGTEPAPPSLLLVTIDTLRADLCFREFATGRPDAESPALEARGAGSGTPVVPVVPGTGAGAPTTPHLAALAARGTRFDAATAVTPLTLPSHATILTGLRTARHGLTVNGVRRESLGAPTLAERLAVRGYTTGAFVSSSVLDRRYGLARGFLHYDDALFVPGGPPVPTERRADLTVDRALSWLGAARAPSFAWVHLFDPHAPYAAPERIDWTLSHREERRAALADGGGLAADVEEGLAHDASVLAPYLDEVRYADAQLGRLLEGARRAADGPVLVVVTSDHGEGLGDHDEETHGLFLHQTTMAVPLVVAWLEAPPAADAPFATPGVVRADAVSLVDLAPTILDALGFDGGRTAVDDDLDGVSVVSPRPGRALPLEARTAWFYYGYSPLVGVRRDADKLVGASRAADPGWRLSDLAHDPGEARDAAAGGAELARIAELARLVRSPDPVSEARSAAADLLALGYLGNAPREDDGPLVDPRVEVALIRTLDRANTAIVEGRAGDAVALLEPEQAARPDVPEVALLLGRALRQGAATRESDDALADLARARAVLGAAAAARPGYVGLQVERGLTALQLARLTGGADAAAEAREALDVALALVPDDPQTIAYRALVELHEGDVAAADARISDALAARPDDATLLLVAVQVAGARGDEARAVGLTERLEALGVRR